MRQKIRCALPALFASGVMLFTGCVSTPAGDEGAVFAPDDSRRLVVYTSHKQEVYWPIIKEFEERTGIWVEIVPGGTNESLERIARESGSPTADVMFGGGVESLESYRDCFTPYVCSEAASIQPQYRASDDLWTPFSSLPVVLIYNAKLVAPEQVTKWTDLFNTRFQGRIAFTDPGKSGSCFTGLVTLLEAVDGNHEDVLHAFADALEGRQLDSSGLVLTTVAEGTNLVGVTLEETALQRIAAGDDIVLVYPADGTSCVPDGSALIKGAAHEDNAKLFLDYTVSRDVQQLLAEHFYRRSVRTDVEPAANLPAQEDIPLINYDVAWASRNHDVILTSWAFCLEEDGTP